MNTEELIDHIRENEHHYDTYYYPTETYKTDGTKPKYGRFTSFKELITDLTGAWEETEEKQDPKWSCTVHEIGLEEAVSICMKCEQGNPHLRGEEEGTGATEEDYRKYKYFRLEMRRKAGGYRKDIIFPQGGWTNGRIE